jgi:integrase
MAAFGSSNDRRYLEKHGNQYRAKLDVPKKLREVVGKAALKKALKTDSLTEAQRLRWPALAELRKHLYEVTRKAKAAPLDPITAAALEDRATRGILVDVIAREDRHADVEALALYDQELFGNKAERIERDHSPAKAREYQGIVRGVRTPIMVHLNEWLTVLEARGIAKRTIKHYRTSVEALAASAGQAGLPQTLEGFGRRHAGDFISKRFIQQNIHYKTAGKFISAMSSYWRWLESRGFIPIGIDNPWLRQDTPKALPRGGKAARQKERPFTDDELTTLLKGCHEDATLRDFMMIAALSGMRIEEIASLRVEDVDLNANTMEITEAKTEAGIRIVPIHPSIAAIVKGRTVNKSPSAWLFDELTEYPPESMCERSMPTSKRFRTYRRGLGVDEQVEGKRRSLVNFHSFRRWFITKAEQAGIHPHIIAVVVGHKTGREGMTLGTYSGGPSIEQRRACVEAVRLPAGTRK